MRFAHNSFLYNFSQLFFIQINQVTNHLYRLISDEKTLTRNQGYYGTVYIYYQNTNMTFLNSNFFLLDLKVKQAIKDF